MVVSGHDAEALDLSSGLMARLFERDSPLPEGQHFEPTRMLLMRIHIACHGNGCVLQQVCKGTMTLVVSRDAVVCA